MAQRRTWVLVLFGVFVLIVVIGIGAVIATTIWFQNNVVVEQRSEGDALAEFEAARGRFTGQSPLIEIRDGRPVYTRERPDYAVAPVETLHILAWDPRDGELARVSVPFWLLRLKSGSISFGEYVSGIDDNGVSVRPEEIERFGPGLVFDTTMRSGERVLLYLQ